MLHERGRRDLFAVVTVLALPAAAPAQQGDAHVQLLALDPPALDRIEMVG